MESTDQSGRQVQQLQRWDQPFDQRMSEQDVDRILALEPFSGIDGEKFPPTLPLRGIIRNDTRLVSYRRGDLIVRAGDYGNSAFLVLQGSVGVVHPPGLPAERLGRAKPVRLSWGKILSVIFRNAQYPEIRKSTGGYDQPKSLNGTTDDSKIRSDDVDLGSKYPQEDEAIRVNLPDLQQIADQYGLTQIGQGQLFGEVAALTRSQRITSVVACEDCELLEIRWQGFRDIRKYNHEFRDHIDQIYRERNLVSHLKSFPLFKTLDDDVVKRIAINTSFESYGSHEWKAIRKKDQDRELPGDTRIVSEGEYVDGVLLILSGSARISRKLNNGEQNIGFLRAGDIFGLSGILQVMGSDEIAIHHNSLTAIGHTDVLRVPSYLLQELVLGTMTKLQIDQLKSFEAQPGGVDQGLLEFIGEHHFVNGTSAMVIDLDRCIRCDECVSACSRNHENNPRFIRHGRTYANLMIANACMHCVDPVCMVGCPTGAISRAGQQGEVVINDESCVGCATCANACPYDNIRMIEIRDERGAPVIDMTSGRPVMKATKCDLCLSNLGGPACQRACPHDALYRLDMKDNQSLAELINRSRSS